MPMDRSKYPPDWEQISLMIRQRAEWKCETMPGIDPDCSAEQGQPHPITGSVVVLTVAHLDHDPANSDPANLRAVCQRCHLLYDRDHHAANAAATRDRKREDAGQIPLLEETRP